MNLGASTAMNSGWEVETVSFWRLFITCIIKVVLHTIKDEPAPQTTPPHSVLGDSESAHEWTDCWWRGPILPGLLLVSTDEFGVGLEGLGFNNWG